MARPSDPTKALSFCAVLYRQDLIGLDELSEGLNALQGDSRLFETDFAPMRRYYAQEMGEENNLRRIFFFANSSCQREFLLPAKLKSLEMEAAWSTSSGIRRVNLDPGMISLENVLLSSFKPYSHRIYLGQGVYAELELLRKDGQFQPLEWTYPDYKNPNIISELDRARSHLKRLSD